MAHVDRLHSRPRGDLHGPQGLGTACRYGRPVRWPGWPWYATDPSFHRHLEKGLFEIAEHRRRVTKTLQLAAPGRTSPSRVLSYRHAGLDVPGRRHRVPVQIQFHENPNYLTYGLAPADYPRVFADPGAASKHRMPDDDALCLYYPKDPDDRRWTHADGLVGLFEIIRDHLMYEVHWRAGGGHGGDSDNDEGIWLGDEAPHGLPDGRNSR